VNGTTAIPAFADPARRRRDEHGVTGVQPHGGQQAAGQCAGLEHGQGDIEGAAQGHWPHALQIFTLLAWAAGSWPFRPGSSAARDRLTSVGAGTTHMRAARCSGRLRLGFPPRRADRRPFFRPAAPCSYSGDAEGSQSAADAAHLPRLCGLTPAPPGTGRG
jgi:hypothetical protein